MPQRKRYTKQFKEEAIRFVSRKDVSLTQVAQGLGINAEMLRRWQKEDETLGPNISPSQGFVPNEKWSK